MHLLTHLNMTTNLQLFNKLNYFKSFLGVFSCDRLPIVSQLHAR